MRSTLAALFLPALFLCACAVTPASAANRPARPAAGGKSAPTGEQLAVFETAEGTFAIRLYPHDAPRTVANFRKLVSDGFYDGLTFHRVVPGFVIQGGDPNSRNENPFDDGKGSPGFTVPAECRRKHVKGAVAMARMPDVVNPKRESNGSQFYIALRDLPNLDGGYTVFGQVVAGWDAVERLVALAKRTDIARVGDDANPGQLAVIRHARLEPAAAWLKGKRGPAAADSAGR